MYKFLIILFYLLMFHKAVEAPNDICLSNKYIQKTLNINPITYNVYIHRKCNIPLSVDLLNYKQMLKYFYKIDSTNKEIVKRINQRRKIQKEKLFNDIYHK